MTVILFSGSVTWVTYCITKLFHPVSHALQGRSPYDPRVVMPVYQSKVFFFRLPTPTMNATPIIRYGQSSLFPVRSRNEQLLPTYFVALIHLRFWVAHDRFQRKRIRKMRCLKGGSALQTQYCPSKLTTSNHLKTRCGKFQRTNRGFDNQ